MTDPDHTNVAGNDTMLVSHGGKGKIGVALQISNFTSSNTWIIDYGVSGHMTYDCSCFLFLNPPFISFVVNANGDFFSSFRDMICSSHPFSNTT